jgi:UDP:flavonoid glycosyltransferase YjiC (YdhE family)
MATVLLLTQGTGGDLFPFMQIARGLRARGHEVTLISQPDFEEEIRRGGFDFASLFQPGHTEGPAGGDDTERQPEVEGLINQRILGACMHIYNTIRQRRGSGATVLVCHYNLNIIGQMSAEQLGLPYVTIFTAPYFLMKLPVVEQVFVAESDLINEYRLWLGLRSVRDWREWLRAPRWKLGLWPEWFAPNDPSWLFGVTPAGFVYDPGVESGGLPAHVEEFLAEGGPAVLVTHGTSRPYKPEFFSASAEACEALGLKALLVTKFDDLVPGGLSDRVLRCKFLPFASAMPRAGAVIHHGGIGTLNQSLTAGVPQLVLGYGFDRPDNGNRVQRLGIGEYLPSVRWRPEPIAESLRRIMTPEVRGRCRDLARRQEHAHDPATLACDVIEGALREGAPAIPARGVALN